MNNPIAKFYSWQVNSGALDGWTSYHLAAGLFIAKIAQWLGSSDFWAVMWVVIIGVAWEIFETIGNNLSHQSTQSRNCIFIWKLAN